jgi:hypothetical protein
LEEYEADAVGEAEVAGGSEVELGVGRERCPEGQQQESSRGQGRAGV